MSAHVKVVFRFRFRLLLSLVLLVPISGPRMALGRDLGRDAREEEASGREDVKMLERMLSAVELATRFFARDHASINVDGLFGLRMGQGQIISALKECKNNRSCSSSTEQRLQKVADDLEAAANDSQYYIEASDPTYFRRFQGTINKPYLLQYRPVTLNHHALQQWPEGSDGSYDEEQGDDCYARLLGTYRGEDGLPVKGCNTTKSCWGLMTAEDRKEYAVTHQILYFILYEKEGCIDAIGEQATKIEDTWLRMCSSVYNEADAESKGGKVSEGQQDLFLEQVILCGMLGFENFMRPDWMRMVLTWQDASGCFSLDDPNLLGMMKELSDLQRAERKVMDDVKWEVNMIEEQHTAIAPTGRKLLREQVIDDGCLSHKSGLGFGVLGLYTRYLLRQVFLDQ